MTRSILAASAVAALLSAIPAAAQSLPEPAVEAQPIDADVWQRQIARDIPGYVRFQGLPEMRFGLVVTSEGMVRSCMALPGNEAEEERGEARGQELCDAFIEHAQFEPARDAEGAAIDSVYIARFDASRPVVAAHYAGVPAN